MDNLSGLGQAQDQGKVRAEKIKPDLLDRVGGWSRVMGCSTCNFFYSLICVIPRVLITSANRLCIVIFFVYSGIRLTLKVSHAAR